MCDSLSACFVLCDIFTYPFGSSSEMAASLGLFSAMTSVAAETPLASALTLRTVPVHVQPPKGKLRVVRAVTSATVSEPPSTPKMRGIMKPRKITPEMQAICGVSEISRTQALKQIWAYIKDNNLQVSSFILLPPFPLSRIFFFFLFFIFIFRSFRIRGFFSFFFFFIF